MGKQFKPPIERTTLTATEAAKYLGISYWLLTRLCKQKQVPHFKISSRLFFRREKLDDWMTNQEFMSLQQETTGYGRLRQIKA